jgi:flagellar biosynthesis protein FliQ
MGSDVALHLLTDVLWMSLLVAAPLLGVTLLVGVAISVVQVITQVQELSLSYVPKIVAAVLVLAAFGPWMLRSLVGFSTRLIANIPNYI